MRGIATIILWTDTPSSIVNNGSFKKIKRVENTFFFEKLWHLCYTCYIFLKIYKSSKLRRLLPLKKLTVASWKMIWQKSVFHSYCNNKSQLTALSNNLSLKFFWYLVRNYNVKRIRILVITLLGSSSLENGWIQAVKLPSRHHLFCKWSYTIHLDMF